MIHHITLSIHAEAIREALHLPNHVRITLVPRIDGNVEAHLVSSEPFSLNHVIASTESTVYQDLGSAVRTLYNDW
jgi:hypothetical protein